MIYKFVILALAILLSAQSAIASADPLLGLLFKCQTVTQHHPKPKRKTCVAGSVGKQVSFPKIVLPAKTIGGKALKKRTFFKKCTVTYMPAATFPAYTGYLPPCNPAPGCPNGNCGKPPSCGSGNCGNPPSCGSGNCGGNKPPKPQPKPPCRPQKPICIQYRIFKGNYCGKWVLYKACSCYGHIGCLAGNGFAKNPLIQYKNKVITGLSSEASKFLLAEGKSNSLVKAKLNSLKTQHKLNIVDEVTIKKNQLKNTKALADFDILKKKPNLFSKVLIKRAEEITDSEDVAEEVLERDVAAQNDAESVAAEENELQEREDDIESVEEEAKVDEAESKVSDEDSEEETEPEATVSDEQDSEAQDLQERDTETVDDEDSVDNEEDSEEQHLEERDNAPRSTNASNKVDAGLVSVVAISMCLFAAIF